MVTLKQLEALYWVAELGTFDKAAHRLHTSQSAISKRILELESATNMPIFDRSMRNARLTIKGEELLQLAQQMLNLERQIQGLQSDNLKPIRKCRLGVTELTAWTWLPSLVTALQTLHPNIRIDPVVDSSQVLFGRLQEGSVDLIIAPNAFHDPDIAFVQLALVEFCWMAAPGAVTLNRDTLRMEELVQHSILVQGSRSGPGLFFKKWIKEQGISITKMLSSDSLNAIVGLTVAGLGVGYFPRACFQPLVDAEKLVILPVRPSLPSVPYVAMYRTDGPSALIEETVEIAKKTCNFRATLDRSLYG